MFLYCIASADAVKIGITTDVDSRLKALQTANPQTLKLVDALPMISKNKAKQVEQLIHKCFKKYRLKGEWFSMEILNLICFETQTIIQGDGGIHFNAELNAWGRR